MPNRKKIIIKETKWKTFLFFLLLAFLFWLMTKFSKEYPAAVAANINYVNMPTNATLGENNETDIQFNLFASGFQFLTYKLKKPILVIDVAKYASKKNIKRIQLNSDQLLKEINLQFPSARSATGVSKDELEINLNPILRKKVPVNVSKELTFKNGYKLIGDIQVVPDSVEISGPNGAVKGITTLHTETIQLQNLEESTSKKIALIIPEIKDLVVNTTQVTTYVTVKEFTQKKFTYDIDVLNKPKDVAIKLIPQQITLVFDISVDDFNTIKKEDFQIACDYAKRNKEDNFMLPLLLKKPKGVQHVEFETQKIDFLIFKK